MRKATFTFDNERTFSGLTDGTTWNGFRNVWVTPAVRDEIVAYLRDDDPETVDELRGLPVVDGLVSLANGYATIEVDPRVERVARSFSRMIVGNLTPSQLSAVRRDNKAEPDPSVCHTHDHVDANVYMAAAMRNTKVRRDDPDYDALWTAAWDTAKASGFKV